MKYGDDENYGYGIYGDGSRCEHPWHSGGDPVAGFCCPMCGEEDPPPSMWLTKGLRYFERIDPDTNQRKFWVISPLRPVNLTFTCSWGRIGTAGQSKEFAFPNWGRAASSHAKRIAEKLHEGYVERSSDLLLDPYLDKAERHAGLGGHEASDHATGCGCSSCVAFHDAVRVANATVRVNNAWRGPAPEVARKCMDALESACRALCVDNTNHVPNVPDDADDLSVFHIEE